MVALGSPVTADGDLTTKQHRTHIDNLWSEYQAFVSGRNARYVSRLPGSNLFADWRVGARYATDAHIGDLAATEHEAAARVAMLTLQEAVTDGIVS